jgi:cytochrome c-type biogenesis protein CcmE
MTRRQRRLTLIGIAAVILSVAAGLALSALRDSIVFFVTPSELAVKTIEPGARFRLGGLVEQGSVVKDGLNVRFRVTDGGANLPVTYHGLLPDLFREGQGVVAEGKLNSSGVFVADTVLAKHDERYMPKEVADALKKQGHWQGEHKPEAGK